MIPGSPLPTYVPRSSAEAQLIEFAHQWSQGGMTTNKATLFTLAFSLPFIPISWKIAIYHFFSILPIPVISPVWMLIIIIVGPWLLLAGLGFGAYFLFKFTRFIVPLVLATIGKVASKIPEQTFFELTFPGDTGKSAYATEQLYTLLHSLARQNTFFEGTFRVKKTYSLEIMASRDAGICYMLVIPTKHAEVIKRNLLAYLPGVKIKDVDDYLPTDLFEKHQAEDNQSKQQPLPRAVGISELKLSAHVALPLTDQKVLSHHDPIAYLSGAMTKLQDNELVAFQIATTPVLSSAHGSVTKKLNEVQKRIYRNLPLTPIVQKNMFERLISFPGINILWFLLKTLLSVFQFLLMFVLSMVIASWDTSGKSVPWFNTPPSIKIEGGVLNPYEQELRGVIKGKIDQPLFETSIRLLVVSTDGQKIRNRIEGLLAAFGPMGSTYQSLTTKTNLLPGKLLAKQRFGQFQQRVLSSSFGFNHNPIVSTSELADLYHFPYTEITKTEGFVKTKSKDLPAPLSLKKSTTKFDVIVGRNTYGGEEVAIGLTTEQRRKHMYILGKTGTGKSTLIKSMVYQDMKNGKGVGVLDPHGDLIKELLALVPKNRLKDVIYFNPADKDFPIGLNLLSPNFSFADEEEGHEWITSAAISVFLKLTPKEYWGPRLEHILRNAVLTALQTPSPTLYTVQRLLTERTYQRQVASTLSDPVLKQFWEKEFKLFGSMQQASAISPLTHRLGKFITSKMSRHILLQEKSTISIQEIMDEGKILLVNLSKGELGEDRSAFFGTLLTSLIQLAAYQREHIPEAKRRDFYLYVDEFQNFATPTFSELMSEGRKYHVSLIPSHQSIAQIDDNSIVKVVADNAASIVCLKAGPGDEAFILPFMEPEVEKGAIVNLAPYHFFMNVTSEYSEDAFSGETVPLTVKGSETVKDQVIDHTRKRYATPRAEVEKQIEQLFTTEKSTKPTVAQEKSRKVAGQAVKRTSSAVYEGM